MRVAIGRQGRANIRQAAERRMIYTGAVSDMLARENESGSMYYADPNHYADEARVNVDFTNFLGGLKGFDRDVALLLVYGETETLTLRCSCSGSPHSYIHDLAQTLGVSEDRIYKGLRRLRDACPQSAA